MRPILEDGAEVAHLTLDPPQLDVDYMIEGLIPEVLISHVPIDRINLSHPSFS